MSLYTLRPISDRTPFTGDHVNSPFRGSGWSDTLDLLARELDMLEAERVVLELDFRDRDIRQDGELRADAKCLSPAVRLAFESRQGPLTFATDRFLYPGYAGGLFMKQDWQHNVRAIALGLEALRKVDRYAISRGGEQYSGYKAIASGIAMPNSHMTRADAIDLILTVAQAATSETFNSKDPETFPATSIRRAKANAHPDRNNGDRTLWDRVEQAVLVLGRSA